MVSSLAAAISDVGLDAADHDLDCEHFPDLRHVALARPWAPMGIASWMGHAGGIWMRGSGSRDYRFAPHHTTGSTPELNQLAAVNLSRHPKEL
jgi:hypothetical protein